MEATPPPPRDRPSVETLWKELRGVVERITYQNAENGFTVARLAPERGQDSGTRDDDRLVTLVGTLGDVYALQWEATAITGYCGPLHFAEAVELRDQLADVDYESHPDTLAALNAAAWSAPVPGEGAAHQIGSVGNDGRPDDRAIRADIMTARDTLLGAVSGAHPVGDALIAAAAMLDGVLQAFCPHEAEQWHTAPDVAGRRRITCWACGVSWYVHGDEHAAEAARREAGQVSRKTTQAALEVVRKREDETTPSRDET